MKHPPTEHEVRVTPYVELLALLQESNLPPGGLRSVSQLATATHLRPGSLALHAGCNAGFLSREVARRTGARLIGIDISEAMVAAATVRAGGEQLEGRVNYRVADMRALPFADQSFDAVFSGGALAFVAGQREAVREWVRVCRPFGMIGDVEFFYRRPPPADIRKRVAQVIEAPVPEYSLEHWTALFEGEGLVPTYSFVDRAATVGTEELAEYVRHLVAHAAHGWSGASRTAAVDRLTEAFTVFNENLAYLDYAVLVYERLPIDHEPLLFA